MRPHTGYRRGRLYRSREDRVLAGVCGGIAEHMDVSPWAIRFFFLLLCFTPLMPFILIAYFVMALVLRTAAPPGVGGVEEEEFLGLSRGSREAVRRRLHQRLEMLDKRLQRLESIVTRPGFALDEEYRKL